MEKMCTVIVQNEIAIANALENQMLFDLYAGQNAVCSLREDSSDKLTALLARRTISRITNGCLCPLLKRRYRLGKTLADVSRTHSRVIVLFFNSSFTTVRYPAEVLKAYKKQWTNIRYVLCCIDSLSRGVSVYANYLREQGVFDAVYSFDRQDAREQNMIFWQTPYSVIPEMQVKMPTRDMYFTGVTSDRYELLHDVFLSGEAHGVNLEMDLIVIPPETDCSQSTESFRLHSPSGIVPYQTVLDRTLEARCILDVVRPNQTGLSLRAYEAVVYNRKLLTNNPSILTFPFYDPRYMRCFETVEDIDWDWVKEDTPVDYHYSGEFSPINLLKDAQERFWGCDTGLER